jgi:hypothetical protein
MFNGIVKTGDVDKKSVVCEVLDLYTIYYSIQH